MGRNTDRLELDRESLLRRIVNRIRQSLELEEVLRETVTEVRSLLGTDRVKIYRFRPDGSGEVIAESINGERLPSLLGLNFPADDIPLNARELFVKERQRSIIDVSTGRIGISAVPDTTDDAMTIIQYRPVDPCHAEYMKAMGVRSSIVIPLVLGKHLWGLLVSHHRESHPIQPQDLQFLQTVADQVCVAISQSTLLSQAREQALKETTINQIVTLLHAQPQVQLQDALEATVVSFGGSGGRLLIHAVNPSQPDEVYLYGEQPVGLNGLQPLELHPAWQQLFTPAAGETGQPCLQAIADLYQISTLEPLSEWFRPTLIRGVLVLPLQYCHQDLGYLTIFRNEVNTERLWAGQFDPDQRQQQPRKSFETWRQSRQGQAPQWSGDELELGISLRNQFAMAVQQHRLYQQVSLLNSNLEAQVEIRTAELKQSAERQKALAQVINKIRASLDLDRIFQATVSEVRNLLEADRVAVFQFHPESNFDNGIFIAEAVNAEFASMLSKRVHDHCFGEQYAVHYQNGRFQIVTDIHNAGLKDCHIEVLSQFQIRANLIVPLLKGKDLWGLLCIHQCAAPRQWRSSEIKFATQIATQLGVALHQTELLTQTRQQKDQLEEMLHHLKQAQTQLIQTEKMSSLGQLVAGVAHEINNPVNFIYGNLNHASETTMELLDLLRLYQIHYPNPVAVVRDRAAEIDIEFLAADLPKILASMKTGTDRIRQIVLSLRNFSRFDQAEMKAVDIHDGIDSTLMILQHRLKARGDFPGIEVIKEYGSLPLVECYAGQLNQVFMNILANAVDALEEKVGLDYQPIIWIRTELRTGDRVCICIRDNGPGIPAEVREKIFDPFFTTKPIGQGTGLGLSISYQVIVDRHHGSFRCNSEAGQGTTFWIEIPLQQQSPVPLTVGRCRENRCISHFQLAH